MSFFRMPVCRKLEIEILLTRLVFALLCFAYSLHLSGDWRHLEEDLSLILFLIDLFHFIGLHSFANIESYCAQDFMSFKLLVQSTLLKKCDLENWMIEVLLFFLHCADTLKCPISFCTFLFCILFVAHISEITLIVIL